MVRQSFIIFPIFFNLKNMVVIVLLLYYFLRFYSGAVSTCHPFTFENKNSSADETCNFVFSFSLGAVNNHQYFQKLMNNENINR